MNYPPYGWIISMIIKGKNCLERKFMHINLVYLKSEADESCAKLFCKRNVVGQKVQSEFNFHTFQDFFQFKAI